MDKVDAHIHIWDLEKVDYGWLQGNTSMLARTYRLAELEPQRQAAHVVGGVLVQADNHLQDTHHMLQVAQAHPWVRGVVGWVDLLDPEAAERQLQDLSSHKQFKGVRHLIHDEPDASWLVQPAVLESLGLLADRGLTYDVVGVLPEHLECALQVAAQHPSLRLVLDHLNTPPYGQPSGRWHELMLQAAAMPNIYAKLSGQGTCFEPGADWSATDLLPMLEFVLGAFGEERVLCGGDWPVALLAGDYASTWRKYEEALGKLLGEQALAKVLATNAEEFYHL